MCFVLKNKSVVAMISARKQIYRLLPRIVNFFLNFDIRSSCEFRPNILAVSQSFLHQNIVKRIVMAKRQESQENNRSAFFPLIVPQILCAL